MATIKPTRPIIALSFLFVLASTGCTLNQAPSISQGREFFISTLAEKKGFSGEVLANYQIKSFEKTDGLASANSGVNYYTLDYKASMEYPEGNNIFCLDSNIPHPQGEWKKAMTCLDSYSNAHLPGAVHQVWGKISFTKTENGWRPTDITIECDDRRWCS